MNCNLVKTVKTVKKDDGKTVKFTNFALKFDNGEYIPVELKEYTSNSSKKEEKEKIERINSQNYAKMCCLADLVKLDETK